MLMLHHLQLAIGTLTTLFGTFYAFTGSKKAPTAGTAPPINAASSDEADFIKCAMPRTLDLAYKQLTSGRKFLESAEAEEKQAKH